MSDNTEYPIIALWAHPRSMSTAIERIMRERNDLCCVHEPFIYYYYIELAKKNLPHFDQDPDKPVKFDAIIADLIDKAGSAPVFFKDMGYYMVPALFEYPALAQRLDHLLLIRDPRKSILSYYKLDPDISVEEIGVEAQWQLFQWLGENTKRNPMIVEASAVQDNPQLAMGKVWNYLGLDFVAEAFEWNAKSNPEDWQAVSGWHGEVQSSTGIREVEAEDESEIIRRFNQIADQAPRLHELLEHHWPFYLKLKAAAAAQD